MSINNTSLIDATIEKKTIESPTTVSLILKLKNPEQEFKYTAGQFISLYVNVNGQEVKRSYSLSSSPHEDFLQLSIKKVKEGELSVYLVEKIKEEMDVKISLAKGKFFTWPQNTPKQYVFLGAGSGTAPLFSMLKSILNDNSQDKILFLCSHKNKSEILFSQSLEKLTEQYPERLQLIYTLSQEMKKQTPCPHSNITKYSGRLNRSLIQNIFNQHLNPQYEKEFYICGPTGYMTEHIENLLFLGVSEKNLHIESFVSKIRKADDKDNPFKQLLKSSSINMTNQSPEYNTGFLIGDSHCPQKQTKTITVNIDGQSHILDYIEGKTVLEVIMDAEIDAPYSCLSGACLSCLATVTEGCVKQKDLGILDDSNINKKESLLCQAYPLSESITLSFD